MPEELRTNLDILAQLNGRSTTEECRTVLEQWVISSRSDPKVMERAAEVQEQIEREANAKRDAISSVLNAAKSGTKSPRPQKPASE